MDPGRSGRRAVDHRHRHCQRYQKSQTSFRTNFRIKRLRLVSSNGDSASVSLGDSDGAQRIPLVRPLHGDWVQVFIDELYPGVAEADVAISELRILFEKSP